MAEEKSLAGQRLARQKRGQTPALLHTATANTVLGLAEAFSNLKVNIQLSDGTFKECKVLITGAGALITIPYASSASGTKT